jgi:GNAT superfamily N-acetyltransferase
MTALEWVREDAMALDIRVATKRDEEACLALIETLTGAKRKAASSTTFEALLGGARGEVLVADDAGVLLGLASVSYNLALRYAGEYAQLEELMVVPTARGGNLVGQLGETAVRHARQRGCAEFGLYLVEATERNRPFYEKYGFECVGSEMRQRLQA